MSDNWTSLHPEDPASDVPESRALEAALRAMGLIGQAFDFYGNRHFRPGPRFPDLLRFDEPSHVESPRRQKPDVRWPEHHVRIEHWDGVKVVMGPELVTGFHCRDCAFSVGEDDYGEVLAAWVDQRDTYRWACPGCGGSKRIRELDWDHRVGFARITVDIWNLCCGEAVPGPELMAALGDFTGTAWTYTYVRI